MIADDVRFQIRLLCRWFRRTRATSRQPLFDSTQVAVERPMAFNEPVFDYLSRSSRPSMASVRKVLEGWFREVPASHAEAIRGRIQSRDDEKFQAAFWEMYLAVLFTTLGYRLTWEPEIADSSGRPDFLAQRRDGTFYVEATSVAQDSMVRAQRNRTRQAYQAISRWDITDWALSLSLEAVGKADLALRDFKRQVQPWLASLDPDAVLAQRQGSSHFQMPYLEVLIAEWRLTVHALPREPARRIPGQPTIAMYSVAPGGKIDNEKPLLRSLERKASKYGRPPHPLVIAVLANTEFATGINNVGNALWGRCFYDEVGRLHLDDLRVPGGPAFKGLWRTEAGRQYARVHAVLVGTFVHPWNLGDELPTLWTASHANPSTRLDTHLARWEEVGGMVTYTQARVSGLRALGLAQDWKAPDLEDPQ